MPDYMRQLISVAQRNNNKSELCFDSLTQLVWPEGRAGGGDGYTQAKVASLEQQILHVCRYRITPKCGSTWFHLEASHTLGSTDFNLERLTCKTYQLSCITCHVSLSMSN